MLSYNLLRISKAAEVGNFLKFTKSGCEISNKGRLVAFATKTGNLYYLEYYLKLQQTNVTDKKGIKRLWSRRYGHFGEQNLTKLSQKEFVVRFEFDTRMASITYSISSKKDSCNRSTGACLL